VRSNKVIILLATATILFRILPSGERLRRIRGGRGGGFVVPITITTIPTTDDSNNIPLSG